MIHIHVIEIILTYDNIKIHKLSINLKQYLGISEVNNIFADAAYY